MIEDEFWAGERAASSVDEFPEAGDIEAVTDDPAGPEPQEVKPLKREADPPQSDEEKASAFDDLLGGTACFHDR